MKFIVKLNIISFNGNENLFIVLIVIFSTPYAKVITIGTFVTVKISMDFGRPFEWLLVKFQNRLGTGLTPPIDCCLHAYEHSW